MLSVTTREMQIKSTSDITAHRSEWPVSQSLQTVNPGEGEGKREPSDPDAGNASC